MAVTIIDQTGMYFVSEDEEPNAQTTKIKHSTGLEVTIFRPVNESEGPFTRGKTYHVTIEEE